MRAVISGIGQSDVGRRLFRPSIELTLDAALLAIEDAGLQREDIDGLAAYPGGQHARPGFAGPSLLEVHDALRLELSWYGSGFEVPAQLSAIIQAACAVSAGLARHVLVYRTVTEGSSRSAAKAAAAQPQPQRVTELSGPSKWLAAYGVRTAPQWYALYLRRYMHDFGIEREDLAAVALHARRMAANNPKAIYRDPLTVDDYLSARVISDPICLFDCDVHCDGSTAFVVSDPTFAADPSSTLDIEAVGVGSGPRAYQDQFRDFRFGKRAASQMWSRTDLKPGDVDVASLYDGFSLIQLSWLESLGFCDPGAAPWFVADEGNVGVTGTLPLNTNGGQLAGGRLHGFGLLYEACLQLLGRAAGRQVAGGEVAVVATGGLPNMSCVLLTKGR